MNTNDPKIIVQALHVENRQLKAQLAALSHKQMNSMLYEKLLCAAVTGALTRAPSPKEAALLALQTADEVAARLNEPKQNPTEE